MARHWMNTVGECVARLGDWLGAVATGGLRRTMLCRMAAPRESAGEGPSWASLRRQARRRARPAGQPPEVGRAWDLIDAIDAGGVPLHPGKVNQIAQGLGLSVSSREPMSDTIERIRLALARAQG